MAEKQDIEFSKNEGRSAEKLRIREPSPCTR